MPLWWCWKTAKGAASLAVVLKKEGLRSAVVPAASLARDSQMFSGLMSDDSIVPSWVSSRSACMYSFASSP